ncbi:MAG: rhomboid family intramembrane serine protease [Actinomycetes bacterium]
MSEGRASVRQPRTTLGSRIPSNSFVTIGLIGACVVVFIWQFLTGINSSANQFGMFPAAIALNGEYYRLFTAMFLHGSLLHIGFNMYVLYMFGPQLESVLGHLRFGLLYLLAGLGGSIASFWFSDPNVVSVGASGAIFGLMGAYIVIMHRLGNDTRQVIGLIGINLVLGFVISGVDWRAHIGGLVTGALVAAIMAYAPARNRALWQVIGVMGVFVLLIALTLVRDQALIAQFAGVVR